MKTLLKNWLLPINSNNFLYEKQKALLCFLFFSFLVTEGQIANYVNNGGFEIPKTTNSQLAKYWSAIDSTKFGGTLLSKVISPYLVPLSSYTYQWPRHGNNFLIGTEYFPTCSNQSCIGYPRNTLKQTLQAGKIYCVKMYVNLSNQSSRAIDAVGAYFGDVTTDTITKCTLPITYLTPQIQNPVGNIISDTLNWILIAGTYTATGSEKYLILGNFKSNANTGTATANPANLPALFSSYCYDDISVIDIDLPAFAGPDIWGIPFNTVYLGRPLDVGIDEACMWYHLPNTTTAIDTAAGITVTVATTTQTYMVKQDICGNIKYDTVIVYASATGSSDLDIILNNVSLFPNPANDELNIAVNSQLNIEINHLFIYNSIGQIIREEEITLKNNQAKIKTTSLVNGIYFLSLNGVNKRFAVAR